MINGATQIIGNIPGQYLNPLLVAESQSAEHSGFIVVTYNLDSKHYDLLFLNGRAIIHCARMNKDLRFFIDQQVVTSTFRDHHKESCVSLFTCDSGAIRRFIATFHSEPCLKVHVDTLSKPQILALVKSTGCTRGIIERNDFSDMLPAIELYDIHAPGRLPAFKAGMSHGRLLVYDLLKNEEIQSHKFSGRSLIVAPASKQKRRRRSQKNPHTEREFSGGHMAQTTGALQENPAEAVEALIHEILGTSDQPPPSISDQQVPVSGLPSPVVTEHSTSTSTSSSSLSLTSQANTDEPINSQESTDNDDPSQSQSRQAHANEQSPKQEVLSPEEIKETKQTFQTDPTDFTRVLERLLRSFRQQVVDLAPQRAESIFAQAEKKIRVLNPELDIRSLDDTNAITVLDLIEEMVKQAPLLKRSKLRETASDLVSDLYNKHYELLERHKAVDTVEQCYYRLKGSK